MNLNMDMEMEMDINNMVTEEWDMDMNNMDFDMNLFDTDPNVDPELPVLIEFNRKNIIELLSEITFHDDTYKLKQYLKITIFLAYMKDQYLFQFNKPELIKKINIMRKFLEYNLFQSCHHYVNYSHKYSPSKKVDKNILKNILSTNSQTNENRTIYNDFDLFSKSLYSNNENSYGISYKLYNRILTIYTTETHIEEVKNIINNINISMDKMDVQCSNVNNKKTQSNIEELNYKMKEIDEFKKNINNIFLKI
jgi:hypothetical protein